MRARKGDEWIFGRELVLYLVANRENGHERIAVELSKKMPLTA